MISRQNILSHWKLMTANYIETVQLRKNVRKCLYANVDNSPSSEFAYLEY